MSDTVTASPILGAGTAPSAPQKVLSPEELTALVYAQQTEIDKVSDTLTQVDTDVKALASETRDGFNKLFSMISDIVGTRNLMISTLVICSTAGVAAICSFVVTFFRG